VVPISGEVREVRRPREQDRRTAQLERAAGADEPDGQAMALSALIKRARNSGRASVSCRLDQGDGWPARLFSGAAVSLELQPANSPRI